MEGFKLNIGDTGFATRDLGTDKIRIDGIGISPITNEKMYFSTIYGKLEMYFEKETFLTLEEAKAYIFEKAETQKKQTIEGLDNHLKAIDKLKAEEMQIPLMLPLQEQAKINAEKELERKKKEEESKETLSGDETSEKAVEEPTKESE